MSTNWIHLSIFSLGFLHYSSYWLWEFIFQENINSYTSNQILHLALPMKATGTYSSVLNWNLWNYEIFHQVQAPNPSFYPELQCKNGALFIERPLQPLPSVVSYHLFPKRSNNFLKHSLWLCKPAFTLRLKQTTPCRWKETWQRPLLLSTSQRQKRPQGTQQNKKLFFLPLPLTFIDLSSS